MAVETQKKIPLLLWPFWALWRLLALILQLTGRLVTAAIGLVLVVLGLVLVLTVVGAPVGVALMLIGALLLIRSIL